MRDPVSRIVPRYGPFHRLRNGTTQTDADIEQQISSGELWGRPRRSSAIPQVQACAGPLPEGRAGLEFFTEVADDRDTIPDWPRWTGPRPGVIVDNGFAKIAIAISRHVK